jgi:hypothetical protein
MNTFRERDLNAAAVDDNDSIIYVYRNVPSMCLI